jgi:glutathionyl-hydroquinone reductase
MQGWLALHQRHVPTALVSACVNINPNRIIPLGPEWDLLAAHGRERLSH